MIEKLNELLSNSETEAGVFISGELATALVAFVQTTRMAVDGIYDREDLRNALTALNKRLEQV